MGRSSSAVSPGTRGAYGESIHIQHADGYRTVYAHMLEGTRIGTGPVSRGQFIGKVGDTGQSTGPHLHIEVQRNGVALNPRSLHRRRAARRERADDTSTGDSNGSNREGPDRSRGSPQVRREDRLRQPAAVQRLPHAGRHPAQPRSNRSHASARALEGARSFLGHLHLPRRLYRGADGVVASA
ncbi:M23 family metallopeptidase [Microbacterium oxydans]|nr:M23 family metallopeptidase [Microbacterium oxydans]